MRLSSFGADIENVLKLVGRLATRLYKASDRVGRLEEGLEEQVDDLATKLSELKIVAEQLDPSVEVFVTFAMGGKKSFAEED